MSGPPDPTPCASTPVHIRAALSWCHDSLVAGASPSTPADSDQDVGAAGVPRDGAENKGLWGGGGSGRAPASHRPPALGSGAPCPAPYRGLLRRVVPVGPGFRRLPSLGCKPPQTRLTQLFCGSVLATAGWRYPAGASLGGGWGRLAGLAGAPLRFTEWPRPHGRAALSPGLCRVTASGELGSGPGSREETVEREGGGGENADGGERRRGTDRMERRGDGETGGTERARRRQCRSPLPPGCKAEWRLAAVRHPRTGFKVTTQISLRSGRWEECQSVTGQAGGKRGGRWVTDGWAVGGGTEGPSRGNPNPV